MSIRSVCAQVSLMSIVLISFFGICSMEHTSVNGHVHREMISQSGCADSECPLTLVADWKPLEKLSQVDTVRNWKLLSWPGIDGLLAYKRNLKLEALYLINNKAGPGYLDRGDSIVPDNLMQAFSQGILHAKIYA